MDLYDSIKKGNLIGKYITGKETRQENEQLKKWLTENPENRAIFNTLKDEKEISKKIEEFESIDKAKAWERYIEKISILSLSKSLYRWKIAATLLLLLGLAGVLSYFLNTGSQRGNKPLVTTIVTAKGQTSKIILPDSSVVWVNSGTTLCYDNNFSLANRNISLDGEAYFSVTRNENIPLIVSCNELKIKVLGTKFDVCAFPGDKKVNVVLEKGSIELSHAKNRFSGFILSPGEMAQYDFAGEKINVTRVNSYKFTSWKDGLLIFKDDPMSEVLEKLERWYGIDIEIRNQEVYKMIFNATIMDENIEDIFELMKYTCAIKYKIIYSHHPDIPTKVIISN